MCIVPFQIEINKISVKLEFCFSGLHICEAMLVFYTCTDWGIQANVLMPCLENHSLSKTQKKPGQRNAFKAGDETKTVKEFGFICVNGKDNDKMGNDTRRLAGIFTFL